MAPEGESVSRTYHGGTAAIRILAQNACVCTTVVQTRAKRGEIRSVNVPPWYKRATSRPHP
ncbi:hypothetical protein BIFGAL_03057 [Bifidobacterium gallicum DSM 20093 = LMG 11596]|uniref:Uncharacterized protein n=1 Tax=Bifidobacterium gallicum DSM 20093 = LMG 11596 TaxID=561180 RepID=D1NTA0_9BIFI|nr:hypothetical protein BIFGAL_03057 [Bifidobacterium gallicum DSM 20093 = LMG 11596]